MNNQEELPIFLRPVDDGLPMRESGQWARNKLDILARYIRTSTIAMQDKPWRRRFYIDLQAGPGKNYVGEQLNQVFLGSPLLALTEGAGYTDYRFVELDATLANALIQRCDVVDQDATRHIKVVIGDCNQVVYQIVDEINSIDRPPFNSTDWNCLSLAFLDPEGLELQWETVLKLASLRRTDIVINFSIGGLRRTAGEALESPVSPIGERVDRFFGSHDWSQIPLHSDGSMPAYEWIEFYKRRLAAATQPAYQWGTDISVKNSRGVELYRLLFASKHELGVKLWEDARKNAPIQRSLF